jgi:hypothetical protein
MTSIDASYSIEHLPGAPVLQLGADARDHANLRVEEFLLRGEARSFRASGRPRADGRWDASAHEAAQYATRLVVIRPSDPAAFCGTVMVEWLNVSAGRDIAVEWSYSHRELLRRGYAWVGVSAQRAGIAGGGLAESAHLLAAAPDRYQALHHPGDAYAYDIFNHAIEAVRRPSGVLDPLTPRQVIAAGHSQSAAFLTTYANAIDPEARLADAFLIHGRVTRAAWLDGQFWDFRRALHEVRGRLDRLTSARIRADVRVPVFALQSETDVTLLGFGLGRQPDAENYRLWEVAGAAHFDSYGIHASPRDDGSLTDEEFSGLLATSRHPMIRTEAPINTGPQQHFVHQAVVDALHRHLAHGAPLPEASRLRTRLAPYPSLRRDRYGNAQGGVRTPWVDAPTAALTGIGQPIRGFSLLLGTTRPLSQELLRQRYPRGRDQYLEDFARSAAAAVGRMHLLAEDEPEINRLAPLSWLG